MCPLCGSGLRPAFHFCLPKAFSRQVTTVISLLSSYPSLFHEGVIISCAGLCHFAVQCTLVYKSLSEIWCSSCGFIQFVNVAAALQQTFCISLPCTIWLSAGTRLNGIKGYGYKAGYEFYRIYPLSSVLNVWNHVDCASDAVFVKYSGLQLRRGRRHVCHELSDAVPGSVRSHLHVYHPWHGLKLSSPICIRFSIISFLHYSANTCAEFSNSRHKCTAITFLDCV